MNNGAPDYVISSSPSLPPPTYVQNIFLSTMFSDTLNLQGVAIKYIDYMQSSQTNSSIC